MSRRHRKQGDIQMKKAILIVLAAATTAACTTVTTYDREGNLLGSCKVSGLMRAGGQCVGHADGAAPKAAQEAK